MPVWDLFSFLLLSERICYSQDSLCLLVCAQACAWSLPSTVGFPQMSACLCAFTGEYEALAGAEVLCAHTGFLRLGGRGFGQSDPQVHESFLLNGWRTQGGVSQTPDSVGLDAGVSRAELGGEPWVSFFPHRR